MKRIDDMQLARTVAALASVGAAAIHFAVVPAHLAAWWVEGVFFAALATFQVLWGLALWRWRRWQLLSLGALVHLGAVLLWVVTRTAGLPFGPNAGVPEPVGLAGVLTIALELAVSASVLWWLRPRQAWMLQSAAASLTAVGGAAVIVLGLSVPGVLAGVGHHHSGHGHGHDGGGSHHPQDRANPAGKSSTHEEGSHQHEGAPAERRGAGGGEKTEAGASHEHEDGHGRQHGHQHEDGGHSHHSH